MTHTGDGLGLPATNRTVTNGGMSACRASDGKIVEGWNVRDQMGMARQLGLSQGQGAQLVAPRSPGYRLKGLSIERLLRFSTP